jgi:hypothetical protein
LLAWETAITPILSIMLIARRLKGRQNVLPVEEKGLYLLPAPTPTRFAWLTPGGGNELVSALAGP